MDHVPRGGDGEQVAVQLGIARHGMPVDVIAQRCRDGCGFLGHVLHVVGKAGMLAKIAVGDCLARFGQVAAAMLQKGRAQLATLGNEPRQPADAVEAGIFLDAQRTEPFIIMDGEARSIA